MSQPNAKISVLFVCMGNICRSPMAEAVFAYQVAQAGLRDRFVIDSAGTGSWHAGETADPRTLAVLRARQIPYAGRARQLVETDLTAFDYVLAMDDNNLSNIQRLAPHVTVKGQVGLFLDYAYQAGRITDRFVPDPYYDNRFEEVYRLVDVGSQALLQHIRQNRRI
jgi:protein-tyrosine phosphatase